MLRIRPGLFLRHHVTWLALAGFCLSPTAVLAYGERTEMESPVERTGESPVRIRLKSTSPEEGQAIGTLKFTQRATGVVIEPSLKGLEPGMHGMHIHEEGSCESGRTEGGNTASPSIDAAKHAGEHWDPGWKGDHDGPWGHGHRGDLPNLYVNEDGEANTPVYAPRVSIRDLADRSVLVHSQRDNYSGEPDAGGSGSAIACGVADR